MGENKEGVPLRHMSFNFEKLAWKFRERAFLLTSLSSSLLPYASSPLFNASYLNITKNINFSSFAFIHYVPS